MRQEDGGDDSWCTRYDYRLQYFNLKKTRSQNALALEDVQRLWIPFLVFDNTEKNEATKGTEDTELTLTREGSYVGSQDDNVEEINIFEGAANRITFEQVYTKTFKCTYQLQLYPFDKQVPEKLRWLLIPRCARST